MPRYQSEKTNTRQKGDSISESRTDPPRLTKAQVKALESTTKRPNCICGPNGIDTDCLLHKSRIADSIGVALLSSLD
jgi:hypothetical protein